MPEVQDGNGRYGCGIGVAQQGFEAFLPTMHVTGLTPALATNATQVALDYKTKRDRPPPRLNAGREKMDGIEEKVKRIAAVVDTLPPDELKGRCVLFMYAEEETCTVSVRGSDEMLTKLTLYSMMSDSSFAEAMIKAVSGYEKIKRMVSRCVSKKEELVC